MAVEIKLYRAALFNHDVRYGTLGRCFTTAQVHLASEDFTAWLIFYDAARTDQVPTNRYHNDTGGPMMIFLPKEQYITHLDLLRNERPIWMIEDGDLWTRGSLRTGAEDVGDGDL